MYQGVSVYSVSKRLGQADLETTVNTYIHLVKELEDKDNQITTEAFEIMKVNLKTYAINCVVMCSKCVV